MFGVDDGGGSGSWAGGHSHAPLAWPKRGHSPGGSTTTTAAGGMVVVEEEVVVGRMM